MFISRADDLFPFPEHIAEPGAAYWRAIGVTANTAWYVLSTLPHDDEHVRTTAPVRWDIDVADSLEMPGVALSALLCMVPDGTAGWTAVPITEVWRATDPTEDDSPCVLLVSADGQERSGTHGRG